MQLKITKANTTIATIPLQPGTYTLGRGQHNDICLTDSSVSRNHAQLEISDDFQVKIVDLNSSNGTRLNDTKITSEIWPPADAVLNIGQCQLVLHTKDDLTSSSHNTLLPIPQVAPQPDFPPIQKVQQQLQLPHQKHQDQQHPRLQQQVEHKVVPKKPTNRKILLERAKLFCVILLICPFLAFLGKNILQAGATLEKVENKQRIKNQSVWLEKKKKAVTIELASVKELITNETYESAQRLLIKILKNNPKNSQALELQKKIHRQLAELTKIQQKKKQEIARKQREQKRHNKEKRINQFKQQLEFDMAGKDFSNCLLNAQKLLTFAPANKMAVTSINFCSKALASSQNSSGDVIAHEKKKLLLKLKNIQKKGEAAVQKKKYEDALSIWAKARKIDPEKIFNTTKTINRKAVKLRKNITKWVKENITKGQNANKNKDYLAARKYYRAALLIKPSDKKTKQLYITQVKNNYILAEEMYREAIAYASLDSLDDAKKAINTAKLLAQGNDKLLKLIDKSIADIQTR